MKQIKFEFKPVYAILILLLCFAYFFVKGVDNGIMVIVTITVKHFFDSTASSIANTKNMLESANKNSGTTTN